MWRRLSRAVEPISRSLSTASSSGGETQALWFTTDMGLTQILSIDRYRPKSGIYQKDERAERRRYARQKRHAAALNASGYDLK